MQNRPTRPGDPFLTRRLPRVGLALILALGSTIAARTVAATAAAPAVQDPAKLLPRPYVLEYSPRVDLDLDRDGDLAIVGVDGPVPAPQRG